MRRVRSRIRDPIGIIQRDWDQFPNQLGRLGSARARSRIVLISNELDMSCQAEDCEFWGPTLGSVDFWGNLRSQRPGTSSFLPVEISVYSIPNLYNYIL